MTLARVICGECGGAVLVSDSRCLHCGAVVELPGEPALIVCPQCGQRQAKGDAACRSCGSVLSPEVHNSSPKQPRKPERPRSDASAPRKQLGSARMWQVVSVVAVGLLLAVLAWTELSRQPSSLPPQAAQLDVIEGMVDLAPLERAVAENPGDVHAKLTLANALQDNGVYSRAIELYKNYLEIHPDDPDARVDMAICYFELARTDSIHGMAFLDLAIAEMTATIERSPKHQPAAFNLGVVYLTAGNLEESTRWFERAVALDSASSLGQRARQMVDQHRTISQ